MARRSPLSRISPGAVLSAALLWAAAPAAAATFTLLKQGFSQTDGEHPTGKLYRDAGGTLYGVSYYGSKVFALAPPAAGKTKWTYSILASLKGMPDASFPNGGLVADAAGNLYGTSYSGGIDDLGSVYELSPPAAGQTAWTEQVIWSNTLSDAVPALLTIDKNGVLTTTISTFLYNTGQVVQLTPPAAGQTQWKAATVYSLSGASGTILLNGLVAGPKGSFYVSSQFGGPANDGRLLQIAPGGAGKPFSLLRDYDFTGGADDGRSPAALVLSGGTLYGGGATVAGMNTILQARPTKTSFAVKTIAAFTSPDTASSLLAAPAGGFYGTSRSGGPEKYWGYDFTLVPPAAGQTTWTVTHVHDFMATDGSSPGPLTMDASGTLYGSTFYGKGKSANGVVYSLAP